MGRVESEFTSVMEYPAGTGGAPFGAADLAAYFSMEFGIHETLPMFAGGLGVLAGDHLKAASDSRMPLVAVGLLYRFGYFHQYLDYSGWQQEEYRETDLYSLPMQRAKDLHGNALTIEVEGPQGRIWANVWRVYVGRVPLFLLDSNVPENQPELREVTARLYHGDGKVRLAQEVLLGIGGMRALRASGITPAVCHMNEGHCAFLSVERLAQVVEDHGMDTPSALEVIPRATVFTTHTPVPAGHDEFPVELVRPYLAPFAGRLNVPLEEIVAWGQHGGAASPFSMFILGLRMAQHVNGVSRLHGRVARKMWTHVWPLRSEEEIPISYVTNGIHVSSWISVENCVMLEEHLGPDWSSPRREPGVLKRIDEIYDDVLWQVHELARARLIRNCKNLLVDQYRRRNAPQAVMQFVESALEKEVLTIGFARRFATYKRATLLLSDPDRLEAMIASLTRPVQFIIAGKAHPRDNEGKELIRRIIEFAQRPAVRARFVFLEDYDIRIARYLVQGADVWLNTPRRPFEACGTSGMKAAANGVLNLSILDGWWAEGFDETIGWRIGNGEEYQDPAYQDAVESQALYNTLESDVIPCFYDRKNGRPPARWVKMMKASMRAAISGFSAGHMVDQYRRRFYAAAGEQYRALLTAGSQEAAELAAQRRRLAALWERTRIATPVRSSAGPFQVGENFEVSAEADLGELRPEEVDVELYYGTPRASGDLTSGRSVPMRVLEETGPGRYRYGAVLTCGKAGRFGFTARMSPRGDGWVKNTPGFITWAQ